MNACKSSAYLIETGPIKRITLGKTAGRAMEAAILRSPLQRRYGFAVSARKRNPKRKSGWDGAYYMWMGHILLNHGILFVSRRNAVIVAEKYFEETPA